MTGGFLLATSAPGNASAARHQRRSLAAVMTSDGNKFDHNSHDFGIVTQDQDPDVDPTTIPRLLNINKGNKQIAHA